MGFSAFVWYNRDITKSRSGKPKRPVWEIPEKDGSLALCQQHQNLDGVGCRTLTHLIAAAIPPKNYVFSGTPMQLDFARMNRSKSCAGLPALLVLRRCYCPFASSIKIWTAFAAAPLRT